jgi:hypothetical protein
MGIVADIGGPMPCLLFVTIVILIVVGIVYGFIRPASAARRSSAWPPSWT